MSTLPYSLQNGAISACLSLRQVKQLVTCLETEEHAACAAAVALMLWGGVNFNGLKRWIWRDVLELTPLSSGCQLPESARLWMKKVGYVGVAEASVLPRGWNRRWLRLKRELGIHDARIFKETHRQLANDTEFHRLLSH